MLEQLRQAVQEGLDSGPATPWSPDEVKQEGRRRRAERLGRGHNGDHRHTPEGTQRPI